MRGIARTPIIFDRQLGVCEGGRDGSHTLRMSAINVPLPGPSSTIRMGEEFPFANHRVKNQMPMSYPERQPEQAMKPRLG